MSVFNHDVPNSIMDEQKTVDDVLDFFKTEVKDTYALQDLTKLDLPKNLHVRLDYIRFDPETDTFFDGKTAFPKVDTVVSSIKYKKMYKGHRAKKEWFEYE